MSLSRGHSSGTPTTALPTIRLSAARRRASSPWWLVKLTACLMSPAAAAMPHPSPVCTSPPVAPTSGTTAPGCSRGASASIRSASLPISIDAHMGTCCPAAAASSAVLLLRRPPAARAGCATAAAAAAPSAGPPAVALLRTQLSAPAPSGSDHSPLAMCRHHCWWARSQAASQTARSGECRGGPQ
jgi:hypothetical protein